MLKVEVSETYAGFRIFGDYNDLDFLYDSINYLIHGDAKSIEECCMQNHLYGFLYEVRHAYQGDRNIELVENSFCEMMRERHGIKKKDAVSNNVYFSFEYLVPDLMLDMMLITYFIGNVPKKDKDIYNPYINMAKYFYSLVLQSLSSMLTEIRWRKLKNKVINSVIAPSVFYPQWFEMISSDYAWMDKETRKKEFMHIMEAIYDYVEFEDYTKMKLEIEKKCQEKNCNIEQIHYDNYPDEIEW